MTETLDVAVSGEFTGIMLIALAQSFVFSTICRIKTLRNLRLLPAQVRKLRSRSVFSGNGSGTGPAPLETSPLARILAAWPELGALTRAQSVSAAP